MSQLAELFALTPEEITLFTELLRHSPQTATSLSKLTTIPRTQVYRLCDSLIAKGVITKIIGDKTTYFESESKERLKQLAADKTKRLQEAQRTLPDFFNSFNNLAPSTGTEVKFYQGGTGIAQMIWHMIDAQGEIVGYTYRDLAPIVGTDFANDFYLEIVNRGIRIRDIYSDSYVDSVGGTEMAEKPTFPHPDWPKLVTSHYLPKERFSITHQLDIYNDTVAFYNWHQGEVFGVEIINPKVASMQRALFEMAWAAAK